jgi:ribosomal peptide maturation radical SAM protein 1
MFDQTLPSVALAKLIKTRSPETLVVLGGYALEGPPGEQIVRAFPWIDGIARGDGEDIITPLARASVGECSLRDIPGILRCDNHGLPRVNCDMRESPDPDYDDWFKDIRDLKARTNIEVVTGALPVESSRGCWWGQRKHCVFCGIDDVTLKFRFKPAHRTLAMLRDMRARYDDHPFRFSDYILPKEYFSEVLPELATVVPRYRLHCEIKANQTPDSVAALAAAGFEEVQPGIESFSTEVLRLMDKGVTGLQNVALLKYGYQNRIVIHYNFIYGFAGEKPEYYHAMLEQIPRLYHLIPPVSRTEAIVTRFAPMQADTARFGSKETPRHHRCYDVLFGTEFLECSGFSLDDYAYYFERYLAFTDELNEAYAHIVAQINHWKRLHRERVVRFDFVDDGDSLRFTDSRFTEAPQSSAMRGVHRAAYLACTDTPVRVDTVVEELVASGRYTNDAVVNAFAELDEARMVWREGERVLGLAVPFDVSDERIGSDWRYRWTAIFM